MKAGVLHLGTYVVFDHSIQLPSPGVPKDHPRAFFLLMKEFKPAA
jgi:hypothetical protein